MRAGGGGGARLHSLRAESRVRTSSRRRRGERESVRLPGCVNTICIHNNYLKGAQEHFNMENFMEVQHLWKPP
ncbi:Hypothetical predicted protein [Podarcis lilfordi]|uniref:Uncharacterized protein n=1 Tax=Podarcis lilfordi TaxID=74358 RepID=A0AA35K5L2_9SAUR|nr:Hypothetical predicted protein [Podarcis lilfordi]